MLRGRLAKNVTEKPGPTVAWWGSVVARGVVAAEGGKAELITAGRGRPSLCRVAWVYGDDFPAQRRSRAAAEASERGEADAEMGVLGQAS